MKWLEIIELRSADGNRKLLELRLKKLINEIDKEPKKQAFKTYTRVMIDTDFSIHLMHDSIKPEYIGSPIGLRVASALKEFGLVNHSVWIEMQSH